MPAFLTSPQPTQLVAIYPGDSIALVNNAAVDAGITLTQQVAFGPTPGNSTGNVVVNNTTNQQAQGEYCSTPNGTYEPLSGFVVPAGSSLPYNLSGGWLCFSFAVAPTSGSLTVTR
jgi:hypothetical protein